jgi:outer membrane protein assembly factor BamB
MDRRRYRILHAGVLALVFLLFISCGERRDWQRFRGEEGQGATTASVRPPLAVKWKLRLQLQADGAKFFNPPLILDDTIYFGSADGNFYALDIESGYMRWVFKTGNRVNSIACGDGDNVYFGSDDGKLYAVSRRTGQLVWSYATGELVQSLVMKYKDMIVFVTNEGAGYFLDTEGNLLFTIPNPNWSKYTFQIFEDTMYFAPSDNEFSGLSTYHIPSRSYLWNLDTAVMGATWYSVPAVDGERVYMSTAAYADTALDYGFFAFDRRNGNLLWQATDTSAFGSAYSGGDTYPLLESYIELLDYMAPSLWGDLVIYAAGDTRVRAYAKRSGVRVWERTFPFKTSSATTIAGDRLYFGLDGSDDSNSPTVTETAPAKLVCLAAADGRSLWETPIEGRVLSAPVIAGKWIVFGTHQHVFYVLEEVF